MVQSALDREGVVPSGTIAKKSLGKSLVKKPRGF